MIAADLLAKAKSAGVRLFLEGGRLAYEGDEAAVEMVLPEIKAHRADLLAALAQPPSLDAILVDACQGARGIDATTYRALLSPENMEDIEGGHYPAETLRDYADSFAEGIASGRIKVLHPADDRRHCRSCRNFRAGRDPASGFCRSYRAHIVDHPPRRCIEYRPRADDPDRRTGKELWQGLGGEQ